MTQLLWRFLFSFLVLLLLEDTLAILVRRGPEELEIARLWTIAEAQKGIMTTSIEKDGRVISIPVCTRARLDLRHDSIAERWVGAHNAYNEFFLIAMWEKSIWIGRVAKDREREAYGIRYSRVLQPEIQTSILDQLVGGAGKEKYPGKQNTPTLYGAIQDWEEKWAEDFRLSELQLYAWTSAKSGNREVPLDQPLLDAFEERIRQIKDAPELKLVLSPYRQCPETLMVTSMAIANLYPDGASLWLGKSKPIWKYPSEC